MTVRPECRGGRRRPSPASRPTAGRGVPPPTVVLRQIAICTTALAAELSHGGRTAGRPGAPGPLAAVTEAACLESLPILWSDLVGDYTRVGTAALRRRGLE